MVGWDACVGSGGVVDHGELELSHMHVSELLEAVPGWVVMVGGGGGGGGDRPLGNTRIQGGCKLARALRLACGVLARASRYFREF